MHIPDGYLSPSTCVAAYAAAAPFWYVASRKLAILLRSRTVPLISAVSAFSFVVMMFNLPLPGGTSGHAVGMGIAAILLGPWAAIVAISIALFIQAVFFGDGGILAFGANALNMAVIGSFVAYGVYRFAAGASAITARRRVVAAALAGYAGLNVSALCAALEFGVQPMLFHDAAGTPLYAPYPLRVAVPAMMLGHLTVAGLAELFITAGLVAFLQRHDAALLKDTNAGAIAATDWRRARRLWAGVAALMIASPLGLLAAGTAWGEWRAAAFADPAARVTIAASSGHVAPPDAVPAGLARLAGFWTAPIPDYAPAFLHGQAAGYIVSALFGGGLIIAAVLALSAMARWLRPASPA